MKLRKARVQNYRSIHDSGWFDVEDDKTVLVGPNEAGKTALLRALQTVSMPPGGGAELNPLRDYPRSRFREIDDGTVKLSDAIVATAVFGLENHDRAMLAEYAPHLEQATELHVSGYYDRSRRCTFGDIAMWSHFGDVDQPLGFLHDQVAKAGPDGHALTNALRALAADWTPSTPLRGEGAEALDQWLDAARPYLDPNNAEVPRAFDTVRTAARMDGQVRQALDALESRIPFFVYYSHYVKVHPRIHLGRLATQEATGDIDEEYDLGNLCLLRFLGLTAGELADLGRGMPDVRVNRHGLVIPPTPEEVREYQDRLDRRGYRLNAASMTLTKSINALWGDDRELDIMPDGQYLKVVVRNEDGARVELDQGSEGFRWLVSFYVVFEAQARGKYANAILLLDEPGVSLHALKQKTFRDTITKLAGRNQTIFTTHSPFMIGSDELDKVRIVELQDRETGTLVHQDFAAGDRRSLYLFQTHFGYELGQTLFGRRRNLVVEEIADYWYLQALAEAAHDAGQPTLDNDVAIIPAGAAGKIAYQASILHAQDLRIAALFDSDDAGRAAAGEDAFVRLMREQRILSVADFYKGAVEMPEVEDLVRDTLLSVAHDELGLDTIDEQAQRRVRDVLEAPPISKYRLAKAFIRWMRTHGWDDLQSHEQDMLRSLFIAVNDATA